MILADTTIWIDHLRRNDSQMQKLLDTGHVLMHPFVVAEMALGSMRNPGITLSDLDGLLTVSVAELSEVRRMIEARGLYARGIGLTDAHLVASCLITPGTQLWTRDAALKAVAKTVGIDAGLL
ncbi:MAG TPA: type II toxin-antitoxin system VapC family toxin [Terracidiphilus sp.]